MDPSSGLDEAISALGDMAEEEFRDMMIKVLPNETKEGDFHELFLESEDDFCNVMKSLQEQEDNLDSVRNEFITLRDALGIAADKGDVDVIDTAAMYMTLAEKKKFTQGRKTELVKASCLYLSYREKNLRFLLIDFSWHLGVSIYELGSVYLKLCEVLDIPEYQDYERRLDPSIFIPHFSTCLLNGRKDEAFVKTAKDNIVGRDWIQTGQTLSEICGEAFHAAGLSHGYKFPQTYMEKVRHNEEATVFKQLIEFSITDSGSLNELVKPDNGNCSFLDKPDLGQGTGAPVSVPPMEIRFFLREATRRAKEAESLIELTSALGNMYLDQRSRQLFESAQNEIRMAVASLDRASNNVLQAKSHPNTMRGRRNTKRKKRAVISPVVVAVANPVVTPVAMAEPALRRSSRVVTPVVVPVAEATRRRSSRVVTPVVVPVAEATRRRSSRVVTPVDVHVAVAEANL